MKKTATMFLTLICLLVFVLSGCGSASSFELAVEALPASLDPQLAQTGAEQTAVVNLYEGLYRRDTAGHPVLAAAKEVAISPDQTIYTFTLKDGLTWQKYRKSGQTILKEVTAHDFVFAFQRIFNKQTRSPWASYFSALLNANEVLEGTLSADSLGVRALDDKTLVLTLSSPDPSLPDRLCAAGAMPCNQDFFQGTEGSYGLAPAQLLANGPFSINLWRPGELLVLRRNTSVNGLVSTLRLVGPSPEDDRTPLQKYNAGKSDGVLTSEALPGKNGQAFQFKTTTWVLLFQTENPFLAIQEIRTSLANSAFTAPLPMPEDASFTQAAGFLPGSLVDATQNRIPLSSTAVEELFKQGVEAFRSQSQSEETQTATPIPSLKILVPEGTPLLGAVQQINQRWQKDVALYCSLEQAPLEEIQKRVAAGEYDMALVPVNAPSGDGLAMLATLDATHSQSPSAWHSDGFAAELSSALLETDTTARHKAMLNAEQTMLSEWPLLPIAFETSAFVTRQTYPQLSVFPFGPVLDFTAPMVSK